MIQSAHLQLLQACLKVCCLLPLSCCQLSGLGCCKLQLLHSPLCCRQVTFSSIPAVIKDKARGKRGVLRVLLQAAAHPACCAACLASWAPIQSCCCNVQPLSGPCNKHGTQHMHSMSMRLFPTHTCCCAPGAAQPLPAATTSQQQPAPWLLPGRQLPRRGAPHCPAAWRRHGACRHHQTWCPSLQVSSSTRATGGLLNSCQRCRTGAQLRS